MLALGVNTPHPLLREVPTISDILPDFEDAGSYLLLAPAATPRLIVERFANEVTRILNLPVVTAYLARLRFTWPEIQSSMSDASQPTARAPSDT